MVDIKNPRLLYAKGAMMLIVGLLASALLLVQHPSLTTALYLSLAVWGFCRAYYFAFYVIEHYIDPNYRYASLWDFLLRAVRKRRS